MNISPDIRKTGDEICQFLQPVFSEIDATASVNTEKVLDAFQRFRVSEMCFSGSTGYGYDDAGRDTLEKIFANVFGAEAALVRLEFVNGTHALTAGLFACLAPGDCMLSVTGRPYDTMQTVIGLGDNPVYGSLKHYGIGYKECDFGSDFTAALADPAVKLLYIQRSRGYDSRKALTLAELESLIKKAKSVRPEIVVFVDNCYGEFTEEREPCAVGADLCAGSLIKNPGGGLAPRGGYICGNKELVERAAFRLTAPGIGGECGSTLSENRMLFQGLFQAPHSTAQALKTAVFCAAMMEKYGFETSPSYSEKRGDTVQTVTLRSPDRLVRFCRGIQHASPVDSFVSPEPWQMPGYDCEVVMAAGTFISGSTSELSCDGPLREPYTAYMQGSLSFESGRLAVMQALTEMLSES